MNLVCFRFFLGSRLTCLCWSKCFGSLSSETFGPQLGRLLPQRSGKQSNLKSPIELIFYTFQGCYVQMGMESILLAKEGGQAAVLVPGGAPEALNCDKGEVGGGLGLN